VDRRRLLGLGLALPLFPRLLETLEADAAVLAPTAACDDDEPTEEQTEGPYFTPRSPLRRSLRTRGVGGTPLTITGRVLDTRCRPIPRALVDVWQCDARGVYDNSGYRLRGHQFTDAAGRWRLDTVVPGLYPGRTRHIHVKVQAPGRPVLTTQLYFPGEAQNARDGIFERSLLLRGYRRSGRGRAGRFDFVLDV